MLLQVPITSISEAVGKPVISQILDKLNKALFLGADIPMYHIDHTGVSTVVGGNLGEENDLRLKASSQVTARTIEIYDESRILTNLRDSDSRPPVWYDKELNAYIKPNMISNKLTVTLTYTSSGRQEALSWGSNYYNRLGRGNSSLDFDVEYDYPVSNNILAVINQLWCAKNKHSDTGDTFIEYLESNIVHPFTYKTNLLGKGATLCFKNTLTHLVGVLSETVPSVTKTDTGYESSIEFTLQYDLPTTFIVNYPAMVYNSYIHRDFIDLEVNRNSFLTTTSVYTDDMLRELTKLDDTSKMRNGTTCGIIIPQWDTTETHSCGMDIATIIQVQLMVDPSNKRHIINLPNLREDCGVDLHPELIPYIADCGNAIFDYRRAAIMFGVHAGGELSSGKNYNLGSDLTISSDYDLHMTTNYHGTLNVLKNLCSLPEPSVEILSKYGSLALAIILCLDINFPVDEFPEIGDDGSVSTRGLKKAFHLVKSSSCGPATGDWYTVNTIITTT